MVQVNIPSFEKFIDIQKVPLLLAYPTSLLASNFIFNKADYAKLPLPYRLSLTIGIIPTLLASATTLIYTMMNHNTSKNVKSSILQSNKLYLSILGLFISAWILGSLRTVLITMVLLINVHVPFLMCSLSFDIYGLYTKDKLALIPNGLDKTNLYAIIVAYIILFSIKDTLRSFESQQKNSLVIPVISLIGSLSLLALNYELINWSMIFVTLACGAILNVTRLELKEIELDKGLPAIVGIISMLLEVSSLNFDYSENMVLTAGEFGLLLLAMFINVDPELFHAHSSEKLVKEEELTILQTLLLHKDTRAIFSFLLLNASFMLVQFLYSFRSKSLGLLSDSLHMALDCTSLALGLVAGVLAKKPPSGFFPFGLSRIETLAGFANGVLLIGIVAGIVIEAIERIINPVNLEKTGELLIVSFLGLVVNVVGIFAFNHGHDHGGHSHGHSHSHGGEGEGECDENQNMKGIFLHILADTLGSAGVVVSTLLTNFFHSNIFDPIASLFIAVLIFFSAIPLIKSSASSLLLSLDDKKDEILRDVLSQVATTPGVIGYTTPRFWYSADIATHTVSDEGLSHSIELKQDAKHRDLHKESHSHSQTDSHSHSHSGPVCSGEHGSSERKPFQLVGFIHIQYAEGENSTIIKKRIEKIFENNNMKILIQVENESSSCWCRTT